MSKPNPDCYNCGEPVLAGYDSGHCCTATLLCVMEAELAALREVEKAARLAEKPHAPAIIDGSPFYLEQVRRCEAFLALQKALAAVDALRKAKSDE